MRTTFALSAAAAFAAVAVALEAPENRVLLLDVASKDVFVDDSMSLACLAEDLVLEAPPGHWFAYHVLNRSLSRLQVTVELSSTSYPVWRSPKCSFAHTPARAVETADKPVVGVLYSLWHTFGAQAMQNITREGGKALTVEQVVRSNGAFDTSEILDKYNEQNAACGFYYQATPQMGFTCVYRGGSPRGAPRVAADCPHITETLTQEAEWLVGSGVDFVTTDATNLGTWSAQAEGIQVRPTEVLFEEWAQLRRSGTPTPQIAVWQTCEPGGTLWKDAAALYNNASYADLVFQTTRFGSNASTRVLFTPLMNQDPALVAAFAQAANATAVPMWALMSATDYTNGTWAFMSPCVDAATDTFTHTIAGRSAGTPCGQRLTQNAPLGEHGTAMAVGPSYQMGYASLGQAPGKMGGLTLKRQFATAFSAQPDFLYLSSWNEWIAQPQHNPYHDGATDSSTTVMSPAARAVQQQLAQSADPLAAGSPYAFSFGLPNDTLRFNLFVDSFGSSLDRDISPSVEGGEGRNGTYLLALAASCLRVARLQRLLGSSLPAPFQSAPSTSPQQPCSVSGELCCEPHEGELWRPVWSLRRSDGRDQMLSADPHEVAVLTKEGAYNEVCTAYPGATDWCVDKAVLQSHDAVEGPFVIRGGPVFGDAAPWKTASAGPRDAAVPLFRCLDQAGATHLFSTQSDCEGLGSPESQLGTIDPTRSTASPRALYRCHSANAGSPHYYHSLDAACRTGDERSAVLGFVR